MKLKRPLIEDRPFGNWDYAELFTWACVLALITAMCVALIVHKVDRLFPEPPRLRPDFHPRPATNAPPGLGDLDIPGQYAADHSTNNGVAQ